MPWRNLLDDASGYHFVSNFAPRPLADGSPRFAWGLARQGGHLAALFCCNRWSHSWSRCILQALGDTQRLHVDPLQPHPPISPEADRVDSDLEIACNLGIGLSLGCRQDDARSQHHALFTAMTFGNPGEFFLLFLTQHDFGGSFGHGSSPSFFPPLLSQSFFSLNVLVIHGSRAESCNHK